MKKHRELIKRLVSLFMAFMMTFTCLPLEVFAEEIGGTDIAIEEGASQLIEDNTSSEIHTHVYEDEMTAPTCTEQGYTTYTCDCGDSYVSDYVDATGDHTYENGICVDCGAEDPNAAEPMSMRYDDHLDMSGKTVEIIDAGTPTSYQVGYGVEENAVPDTAVITLNGDTLVATGIGTAKIKIDGAVYEVTVTAAPISLLLVIGQSNAEGMVGNANQSVACENGQVYSTYAKANGLTGDAGLTVENAGNYVPSALSGQYSTINVNGTDTKLSGHPVNSLTEAGNGKYGMDSGLAYEWTRQTGEKVWIVNAAHGASSISSWQPGQSNFEEANALMNACQEVLLKEIAAGHYTFSRTGYYWCQGCADESKTAKWYVEQYNTMHNALKTEMAFDADLDSSTPNSTLEFGGIILVMAGHENVTGYRKGTYSDSSDKFFATFKELEMRGPRVAQIWMANNPELPDIHVVCTLAQDWVTMPDGSDGVAEYFASHYENGKIDYPTQTKQSASWYTPTTPAAVKNSIHYYQVGYNEVGRESVRNTLYILGLLRKPNVETTVTFVDWTGYQIADCFKSSISGTSETLVVPMVYPCYESKNVTYTVSEDLEYTYYDLLDNGSYGGTLTASIGNKAVEVIERSYYRYRFELSDDGSMTSVTDGAFRENPLSSPDANQKFYQLQEAIVLKHDKAWRVEFNSVEAARFMALTTSKSTTDGMFYFFKSKSGSGVLSMGEYKDGFYQNYGLKQSNIAVDWSKPHVYRFQNVVNDDGSNTIHIFVDDVWVGTATNLIINDVLKSTDNMYLSGKDFAFTHIGCGGFALDADQMTYLEVWEDYHTHTYENGICIACGEKDPDYVPTFLYLNEAVAYLREQMKARIDTVTLRIADMELTAEQGNTMLSDAIAHTGVPTEGDYFRRNMGSKSCSVVTGEDANGVYSDVTFKFDWYTTAEMEAEVNAAVEALLDELNLWSASDYEKIVGVYDWIGENIEYDHDRYDEEGSTIEHTTYAAIIDRLAVCQGYASLYYRLLLELGVDCRVISGLAGLNGGEPHAWNIVKLEGKYYNADPTWDADLKGHYRYFLCTMENFKEHVRDDEFDSESFHTQYPMSLVPYVVNAAASGSVNGAIAWVLDGETGTLTVAGTGAVPSYRYGSAPWYPYRESVKSIVVSEGITEVGERAFYWCTNCTSVTLPESLVAIREYGFNNLRALQEIKLPSKLTTIEFCAFSECVGLQSIVIPNSVTTIGGSAFSNCYALTSATLSAGMTTIPDSMFFGDRNLKKVVLQNGLTTIGDTAFADCGITSFTIPATVTSIGVSAFAGCRSNNSFTVKAGNTAYKEVNGVLFTYDGKTLISYPAGKFGNSYAVPEGTVTVGRSAFSDAYMLKTITFASSVRTIMHSAFAHCDVLASITFPSGITSIGDSALRECNKLTSVTFENPDVVLGPSVFADCDGLVSIQLPTRLKELSYGMFSGCAKLKNVTIPSTVTKMGSTVFADCDSLVSITVPGNVKSLGQQAFDFCNNLETIIFEEGVESLGWICIRNAPALKKVVLPSSITTIEKGNFEECPNVVVYVNCGSVAHRYAQSNGVATSVTHSYETTITVPTCTTQGYTTHTCAVCGSSYKDAYVSALGHSYGDWEIVKESTCTEQGSERRDCVRCDVYETQVIEIAAHPYESIVTPPTCTEQGYTTHTCSACGNSYVDSYVDATGHSYNGIHCSACGEEHPNKEHFEGKVISILSASTSTFAGYIPTADGFNLEHRARYPQDNLLTDVNETWWMQVINDLGAKLGINESWAGSQVLNTQDSNSGDLGPDAAMASVTRIKNLGANGTPDIIFFFGGGNDIGRGVPLGSFDAQNAPTQVDLTTKKWSTFADAYVAAIMRLQHFYPDSQIVVMTTYEMPSYATAAKLNKYAPVIQAICDHYGVKYVDLRNSGLTFDMLPDNIHPNAEGMDHITNAVLDKLLSEYEIISGENVVYSVTHNLENAGAEKHYYKGISEGKNFTESVSGEELTVTVIMGGKDITAQVYKDGKISIPAVTGDVLITARGKFTCDGHLQQLPDTLCAGTNLWKALEPENIYYLGTKWGLYSNSPDVYSITFPVVAGERIWATSFGKTPENGSTANGTRITWFSETGVLESLTRDKVYAEFAKNGYITVPSGAVVVNIPYAKGEGNCEVYLLDRAHDYKSVVTAPTCTERGYTTHTCTVCGDSYVDSYVDATGHSYGEWTVTTAPTCTEKGTERRDCKNCDHFETRTVAAKGHTEVIDKAVTPTCTETGLTEGKHCSACDAVLVKQEVVAAKGHSYKSVVTAPTCTERGYTTHTCTVCGDSYVDSYMDAAGHSYGEWSVITAPTCTEQGVERRDCVNCDHFETREVAAIGHTEVIDEAVDPTCTETGLTEGKHCSVCTVIIVAPEILPALGHKYAEWFVSVDATCIAEGEEKRECERCDAFETKVIAALGHTEVIDAVMEATCIAGGLTEGKHCSVCETVLVAQEIVPPLGHTFGAFAPVSTNPELGHYQQCLVCDHISTVISHADTDENTWCDDCNYSMLLRVQYFALSHEYILLTAGESAELLPIIEPAGMVNRIVWSSSDETVFTIDEKGVISAKAEGTAYAEAYVTSFGEEYTMRCRVDVSAEPIEEIELKAHIGVTNVTSNIYSTNYAETEIILDLPHYMTEISTFGLRGNGISLESAYFVDASVAALFDICITDDRVLQLIPKVDTDDAAALKMVKSSYKSAIAVTLVGEEEPLVTPEVLNIRVDKKLPTVKATAVKLNTFFTIDTKPLVLTSTAGKVTAIEVVTHPDWLTVDCEMMQVSIGAQNGKYSGKLKLLATVEGYTTAVPVTVSVSAAVTKPKVKLSSTSATIFNQAELSEGISLSVLSGDKKIPYEDLGITNITLAELSEKEVKIYAGNSVYEITDFDITTGQFSVSVREGVAPISGKVLLKVTFNDIDSQFITLPLSIKLYAKAPVLKLSKTSATLNNDLGIGMDSFKVKLTVTPADYNYGALDIHVFDKTGKIALTDVLNVQNDGDTVIIRTTANTEYSAMYKVTVGLADDPSVKPVTITIKTLPVNKGIVTLTLTGKGSIDTVRPYATSITLTPRYKNYNNFGVMDEDFTVLTTNVKAKPQVSVDVTEKFDIIRNANGTYTLRVKNGEHLDPTLKYTISMSSENMYAKAESKAISLSVKQGSVKVSQSTKRVNLYKSDRFSRRYVMLSIADETVLPIDRIELQNADKSLFEVLDFGNGLCAIGFKDSRVAPKVRSGSIKLNVFLQGNDTTKPNATVSLSVNVVAFR